MIRTEGLTKRYGPDHRRRRHRPRRPRGRRLRLPRRQRLRQDDDGADAARPGAGHLGTIELLGERMPRAARRVLPQVGALVEGPAAYGHLSGRAQPRAVRRDGAARRRGAPGAAGSTTRSSRSGSRGVDERPVRAYSLGMRQRLGLAGALLRRRGCWCSTSRPTAWTRRASPRSASCCSTSTAAGHDGVPLQPPARPRSSSCAPGSACSTAGGWSCRTTRRRCSAHRPGRWCTRPTPERVRATARRRRRGVRRRAAARPRADDPAALNARLVQAGIRVDGLAPERPTLEEVVLAATTASADRVATRP